MPDGEIYGLNIRFPMNYENSALQVSSSKPIHISDHGSPYSRGTIHGVLMDALDHLQELILDDFGYAGFRYDMVKGYSGKFTGIYNYLLKRKILQEVYLS